MLQNFANNVAVDRRESVSDVSLSRQNDPKNNQSKSSHSIYSSQGSESMSDKINSFAKNKLAENTRNQGNFKILSL